MFPQNMYSGPGRKNKLTGGMKFFLIILLILQCGIIVFALNLSVKTKVKVIWLDPYLQISIQGADGYAVAEPVFDEDAFRTDFEDILQKKDSSLQPEEAAALSRKAADSMIYELHISAAEGETSISIIDDEEDIVSQQENFEIPVPGISNGDTVTVFADISEETWTLLRDRGFYLSFECDPVSITAEGLTEAAPYDPFEDLTLAFTGLNGVGRTEIYYNSNYPFSFSSEPSEGLSNGDQIEISLSLDEGYDLNRVVEEFHIMPVSLSRRFTVAGLYVNPTDIDAFTSENRDSLMQQGRLAASSLLEEEYEDSEMFVLDDVGMYFAAEEAVSGTAASGSQTAGSQAAGTGEDFGEETAGTQDSAVPVSGTQYSVMQTSGIQNYLFCVFAVNYTNSSGEDLQYYYYVRFENLMLDDSGEVIADFAQYDHPRKPSIPLIGEALGDGAEVSVPGILSFRTLAGYETLEQLISRAVAPLESEYTVTSIEQ